MGSDQFLDELHELVLADLGEDNVPRNLQVFETRPFVFRWGAKGITELINLLQLPSPMEEGASCPSKQLSQNAAKGPNIDCRGIPLGAKEEFQWTGESQ